MSDRAVRKPPQSGFPERLRELRAESGMTQQQLAEGAGLSIDSIRQLEGGRYEPMWPTVLALAAALGVGTDQFKSRGKKKSKVAAP